MNASKTDIIEPYVDDTDVVEMPYTPEYVAKLKEALEDMLLTYQTAIEIVGNKTFVGILKGAGVCNEEDDFNHVMNKAREALKYKNTLPLPNNMTFLEACNFSVKLLYTHGFITRNQREAIWKNIEDDYWKESKQAGLDHISDVGKMVDKLIKENKEAL